ncbi:unnamed protein product [Ectocarpus sp. 6 AP-2014]
MRLLTAVMFPWCFCRGLVPAARSRGVVARGMGAPGLRRRDGGAGAGTRVPLTLRAGGRGGGGGGGVLPREKLLKQAVYEGMEKLTAAKLLDGADSALKTWSTYTTGFLPPPDVNVMAKLLDPLLDVEVQSWGGHEQAERKRLFVSREGVLASELESEVVALEIGGQFLFDMADHRDFLGAIVNLGVTRDGIGDILVQGERGAQVLVDPVMAEFLAGSLTSVRSVKVKVRPIPLEELAVRPAKTKDVSTVEASLRLDSVASAGMGMSRSKMSAAVKSGLVLVNWKAVSSGTTNVKEGDVVTVRGKGRVEIGDITVTKKGRYKINMCRTT